MTLDPYPTEEELARLRAWPFEDTDGAFDFLKGLWWPDAKYGISETLRPEEAAVVGVEPDRKYLRLATGGWSGNEDLIDALSDNGPIWILTHMLSARGGLHIFRLTGLRAGSDEKAS